MAGAGSTASDGGISGTSSADGVDVSDWVAVTGFASDGIVVSGCFAREGARFFFLLFLEETGLAVLSLPVSPLCAKVSKGAMSSTANKNDIVIVRTVAS